MILLCGGTNIIQHINIKNLNNVLRAASCFFYPTEDILRTEIQHESFRFNELCSSAYDELTVVMQYNNIYKKLTVRINYKKKKKNQPI